MHPYKSGQIETYQDVWIAPVYTGSNPMVGMTVSVAVAVEESLKLDLPDQITRRDAHYFNMCIPDFFDFFPFL